MIRATLVISRMWNPRTLISASLIALAFAYAVIRYHIVKGVSWSEFPLFISNKAIALSAVALIAVSYAIGSLSVFWPQLFEKLLPARKFFGLLGFGFAAAHAIISLLIFNASYYPKFFENTGKLNLTGELSLLFGVISFAIFSLVAITSVPSIAESLGRERWLKFQHLGYWGLAATLGHVFVMGFKGWMDTAGWPGGLLPISLVAFIIVLSVLFLRSLALLARKN